MRVNLALPLSTAPDAAAARPAPPGAADLAPSDRVSVSPEARDRVERDGRSAAHGAARRAGAVEEPLGAPRAAGSDGLTGGERREVDQLQARDRAVRAHEAAHEAAGGSLVGAPVYVMETGPDGKSYAVGGHVPVDLSPGRTPEETIARAEQVRAAALAPVDPSPADMAVAAAATQMEMQARAQEIAQSRPAAPARALAAYHAAVGSPASRGVASEPLSAPPPRAQA